MPVETVDLCTQWPFISENHMEPNQTSKKWNGLGDDTYVRPQEQLQPHK
jgi:hypothetical protein